MSSGNNRLRFHMGCGERLQSRRRIVRCVYGALLRTETKPGSGKARHGQRQQEGGRDET
jgi:hypothetical protein